MCRIKILLTLIVLAAICHNVSSQNIVYTDAAQFPVFGKIQDNTSPVMNVFLPNFRE